MFNKKILKPAYFIILFLSLVSYKLIDYRTLTKTNVPLRITVQNNAIVLRQVLPENSNVLTLAAGFVLQKIAKIFSPNSITAHSIAYNLMVFIILFLTYFTFFVYLKIFFTESTSLIGALLLGIVMQLGLTGTLFPEGNLLSFLLFILGFLCMFKSKDYFLPVIFAFGIMNNAQTVFLFLFYVTYLISQNKLRTKKSHFIILFSVMVMALTFLFMLKVFGDRVFIKNDFIFQNLSNPGLIFQLWFAEIAFFVFLSIKAFNFSSLFFKLGLFIIGLYFILGFFYEPMNEPVRFLPVYLILIPMSLQILFDKSVNSKNLLQRPVSL